MITLYDFASKSDGKPWNVYTLRTRLSLGYKGLPFKTIWIEYPEIESVCKRIGAPSTEKKYTGEPHYTFPVIFDDSTGRAISDSFLIAEYLDTTYPELPTLIPNGTRALQLALRDAIEAKVLPFRRFMPPASIIFLNEPSLDYIRRLREPMFGMKLEEFAPAPGTKERAAVWAEWRDMFGTVDAWMRKDDIWVTGSESPSFADFVIAPEILVMRWWLFGEESTEWKDVVAWHDGRWARLAKSMEPYL